MMQSLHDIDPGAIVRCLRECVTVFRKSRLFSSFVTTVNCSEHLDLVVGDAPHIYVLIVSCWRQLV